MQTSAAVEDWLRVHRQLLAKETAFTDLAMRAAAGEVSTEELADQREQLMEMRALCAAAYAKAFPNAVRSSSNNASA